MRSLLKLTTTLYGPDSQNVSKTTDFKSLRCCAQLELQLLAQVLRFGAQFSILHVRTL